MTTNSSNQNQKNRFYPYIMVLRDGFFWFVLTAFFGTLQIALVWFLSQLIPANDFSLIKVLQDGVLLFFAIGLSSAVMVDYVFSKASFDKRIELMFYLTPLVVLSISAVTYAAMNVTDSNINVDTLKFVQFAVLFVSGIYALFLKSIVFLTPFRSDTNV